MRKFYTYRLPLYTKLRNSRQRKAPVTSRKHGFKSSNGITELLYSITRIGKANRERLGFSVGEPHLMRALSVRRVGKDQKIGKYVEGGIFAGYTKCEQCSSELKIVLRVHEVRELSRIAGIALKQDNWKVRVLRKIEKWAKDAKTREATRG